MASLGHPCKFQRVSRLGSVTARHLVVGVSQTAAFNRGRHLCSEGRPSRWALADILVHSCILFVIGVHSLHACTARRHQSSVTLRPILHYYFTSDRRPDRSAEHLSVRWRVLMFQLNSARHTERVTQSTFLPLHYLLHFRVFFTLMFAYNRPWKGDTNRACIQSNSPTAAWWQSLMSTIALFGLDSSLKILKQMAQSMNNYSSNTLPFRKA